MKKFLLLITLLMVGACAKSTPTIKVNVIPAKDNGPVLTQIDVKIYPPHDNNSKYYNAVISVGDKTKLVWFDKDIKEVLESKNEKLTDGVNEYKIFINGKYSANGSFDTTELIETKLN